MRAVLFTGLTAAALLLSGCYYTATDPKTGKVRQIDRTEYEKLESNAGVERRNWSSPVTVDREAPPAPEAAPN